ncbi:hypothetical protein AB0395_22060 [Streptosporangium sp. NPDC051023]|uniref:hypothetical protein n=1 Tax=Streptosporangium sp. NPDC051023 TaxID=3155410 RepID=UPI00344CF729
MNVITWAPGRDPYTEAGVIDGQVRFVLKHHDADCTELFFLLPGIGHPGVQVQRDHLRDADPVPAHMPGQAAAKAHAEQVWSEFVIVADPPVSAGSAPGVDAAAELRLLHAEIIAARKVVKTSVEGVQVVVGLFSRRLGDLSRALIGLGLPAATLTTGVIDGIGHRLHRDLQDAGQDSAAMDAALGRAEDGLAALIADLYR